MLALLKEHIPVKQGLRRVEYPVYQFHLSHLKEHIPVKQGLRLVLFVYSIHLLYSQRAYSSKTRIKTEYIELFLNSLTLSKSIFQ